MSASLLGLLTGTTTAAPGLPQEPVVLEKAKDSASMPGFEEMMAMMGMMNQAQPNPSVKILESSSVPADSAKMGAELSGADLLVTQISVPAGALPEKDLKSAVNSLNQTAKKAVESVPQQKLALINSLDPLLLKRALEGPGADLSSREMTPNRDMQFSDGAMAGFDSMPGFEPIEGAMVVKASPKLVPSNDFLAMRDLNQPRTRESAMLAPKLTGLTPATMDLGMQASVQRESMSADLKEFNQLQDKNLNDSMTASVDAPSVPFDAKAPAAANVPVVLVSTETRSTGSPKMNSEAMQRIAEAITTSAVRNPSGVSSEVRLRLKPEALGEVRVTVKNLGDRLDVRFETGSADARKAIETSLGELRDRLTQGSFQVAQLEVQAPQQSLGSQLNSQMNSQSQQSLTGNWGDSLGQQTGGGNAFSDSSQQRSQWDFERDGPVMASGLSARTRSNPYASAANGRLDVRA